MAPEKIENIYLRSPFVAQAFVQGDSLRVSKSASFCNHPLLVACLYGFSKMFFPPVGIRWIQRITEPVDSALCSVDLTLQD